jgi:hypothetical protein
MRLLFGFFDSVSAPSRKESKTIDNEVKMFLQNKSSATLIKITDLETLFNPLRNEIEGRIQEGEEEQEIQPFPKQDLTFASGEDLPRCWIDPNYRN